MVEEDKKETKPITMKDVKAKAEERKCPVQQSLVFIEEFLAEPMCGKCFPCSMGSYEARIRLRRIVEAEATEEDIERLKRIASNMLVSSMCKKGKDTAQFISEKITLQEFRRHLNGKCPDTECKSHIKYIIIPEKCTMCGLCKDVCKDNAIIGEKRRPYLSGYLPFEIAEKRCTKCGECIKVCPEGAIIIVSSREKELVGV